ncbi:MAG: hypothetical protein ENTB_05018 [Enterocloster aldenensis]
MKLRSKQKKWMMIAGGAVICIVLAAAIGSQFRKQPGAKDVILPEETEQPPVILADIPYKADAGLEGTEGDNTEEEAEVVIRTGVGSMEETGEALPPQTDKEEQKLQEEVTKPEEVPEEVLHDPTRKPDGEIVEGEPVPEEHEEGTRPEEPVVPEGTPQAGDTSGGQIYIPGFGWVENQGGGASGTTAGDMYENGNKIGSMD